MSSVLQNLGEIMEDSIVTKIINSAMKNSDLQDGEIDVLKTLKIISSLIEESKYRRTSTILTAIYCLMVILLADFDESIDDTEEYMNKIISDAMTVLNSNFKDKHGS